MRFLNVILQIALIVAWYVVPSFALVPWYVIFLPTLIPLTMIAVIAFIALIVLIGGVISHLISR